MYASSTCVHYLNLFPLSLVPPSLDTRGVNAAVRAVAGDRVKFCFPYVGEPAPEIRWVREGEQEGDQEVQSDRAKAVTLSSTADETKLVRVTSSPIYHQALSLKL